MKGTMGQQKVRKEGGTPGERKAKEWLWENGFEITKHWTKRHAGPYDKAEKGGDNG